MHVEHAPRPRALVQIVDVLRYDQQLAAPSRVEPRQRRVRRVRLLGLDGGAAHIVESQHEVGVTRKSLGRGDVFHAVLFPQARAAIGPGAERVDAAFRGYARAGQNHDVACRSHARHEAW